MTTRRRVSAVLAGGAGLLLAAGTGVVAPAGATTGAGDLERDAAPSSGGQYVALGDSFSAGVGTRDSQDDDCYRAPLGYPQLVAQDRGLALSYQACTGAVTDDVLANQVGALGTSTELVTVTIGGNDVGFTDVVIDCGLPAWMADCQGAIDDGRAILNGVLPGKLDQVYGQISSRAPSAEVVVASYPRLFNGEDCNALTFFSAEEMAEINEATDELSALIQTRSTAAGHDFVDPGPAFLGHAVCDDVEWVNGLSVPVVESFHPNVAGNAAYADLVSPGAGSFAPQTAPTSTSTRLEQEVQRVLALDLTSPANLALAREAGVDTDALTEYVTLLSSDDTADQQQGLDGLAALDEAASD